MQIILSIHFFFLERLISINLMTRIAQLMLMVQQGTACRYPALLAKYSFCYLLCQNETKVAAGYRHAVR